MSGWEIVFVVLYALTASTVTAATQATYQPKSDLDQLRVILAGTFWPLFLILVAGVLLWKLR